MDTTQGQTTDENTSESELTTESPMSGTSSALMVTPSGQGSSTVTEPPGDEKSIPHGKVWSPWQTALFSQGQCGNVSCLDEIF